MIGVGDEGRLEACLSLYSEARVQQLYLMNYYVCSVQFHNKSTSRTKIRVEVHIVYPAMMM